LPLLCPPDPPGGGAALEEPSFWSAMAGQAYRPSFQTADAGGFSGKGRVSKAEAVFSS
jgi:hypothetical protein